MKKKKTKVNWKRAARKLVRRIKELRLYSVPLWHFPRWCINRGKSPDFMIIGTQKGGTSFLVRALAQHPGVEIQGTRPSLEFHFFNVEDAYRKGVKWYKKFFNDNGKLQGEKTPEYCFLPKCHPRMFAAAPDAKLILLLRDPVKRAFSAYNHAKQLNKKWGVLDPSESFEAHVKAEERLGFNRGFVARGFYLRQIRNLLKYYKRERLLILISEEVRARPREKLGLVFKFLGLKIGKLRFAEEFHTRQYAERLSPELEQKLREVFRQDNERLFEFLGRRIDEWQM